MAPPDEAADSRTPPEEREPRGLVDRAFRSAVGDESTAFGFSITVTLSFGALQVSHGSPKTLHLFMFAAGAVCSFTALETLLTRGFREGLPEHDTHVSALSTALNFVSVLAALGAAVGAGEAVEGGVAWLVGPLAATLVYLCAEAVEVMIAERVQKARGDPEADEVRG